MFVWKVLRYLCIVFTALLQPPCIIYRCTQLHTLVLTCASREMCTCTVHAQAVCYQPGSHAPPCTNAHIHGEKCPWACARGGGCCRCPARLEVISSRREIPEFFARPCPRQPELRIPVAAAFCFLLFAFCILLFAFCIWFSNFAFCFSLFAFYFLLFAFCIFLFIFFAFFFFFALRFLLGNSCALAGGAESWGRGFAARSPAPPLCGSSRGHGPARPRTAAPAPRPFRFSRHTRC